MSYMRGHYSLSRCSYTWCDTRTDRLYRRLKFCSLILMLGLADVPSSQRRTLNSNKCLIFKIVSVVHEPGGWSCSFGAIVSQSDVFNAQCWKMYDSTAATVVFYVPSHHFTQNRDKRGLPSQNRRFY